MKKIPTPSLLYIFVLSLMLIQVSCVEDRDRDEFLGQYHVSETCGSTTDSYNIDIIRSDVDYEAVEIFNLWDWGDYVMGQCSDNKLTIPQQNINGMIYEGSGIIDGIVLTIDLSITSSGSTENCTLVCTQH